MESFSILSENASDEETKVAMALGWAIELVNFLNHNSLKHWLLAKSHIIYIVTSLFPGGRRHYGRVPYAADQALLVPNQQPGREGL